MVYTHLSDVVLSLPDIGLCIHKTNPAARTLINNALRSRDKIGIDRDFVGCVSE